MKQELPASGDALVHKDFNPSGKIEVAEIKEASAHLANLIQKNCPEGDIKTRALMDLKSATMFAVSSIFS